MMQHRRLLLPLPLLRHLLLMLHLLLLLPTLLRLLPPRQNVVIRVSTVTRVTLPG